MKNTELLFNCRLCNDLRRDEKELPEHCVTCDLVNSCIKHNNYMGFLENTMLYESEFADDSVGKRIDKIESDLEVINNIGKFLFFSSVCYIAINVLYEYIKD